jgi:hypothetical protein
MQSAISTARQTRTHYRHDLHTLTYVILDEANGGIVRNLTHEGAAVQAVGALRVEQTVRLRFELRNPPVRIETRGEVMWANSSGRCGIRFIDLPPGVVQQINRWIFGNLLEMSSTPSPSGVSMFQTPGSGPASGDGLAGENDGLTATQLRAFKPALAQTGIEAVRAYDNDLSVLPDFPFARRYAAADWLSQPLSGRSLALTVDVLMIFAALLVFALVFLSVNHELPRWPVTTGTGMAALMAIFYWSFFRAFGGPSLGVRLARLADLDLESQEARDLDRFR